jgi:hypothetical protein
MAEHKHPLQSLLESDGLECQSYSGRNMYGQTCLGVVTSLGELMASVTCTTDLNSEEVCEAVRGIKLDSLGHDTIYYFPEVSFVEG